MEFVTFFVLILNIIMLVKSQQFVLDKASDVDGRMWKVQGFTSYLEDGNALRGPFHEYLPKDFDYGNFAFSSGIWTIVPNNGFNCDNINLQLDDPFFQRSAEDSNPCDNVTNAATFQFKAAAQLLSSVTIQYNFGGNATLTVSGGGRETRYVEAADGRRFDKWISIKVPLDGSYMNLVATVYERQSYVLIDTITVNFMEAPTKPPRSTTTTTEPPPLVDSADHLVPGLFTLMSMTLATIYLLLL